MISWSVFVLWNWNEFKFWILGFCLDGSGDGCRTDTGTDEDLATPKCDSRLEATSI